LLLEECNWHISKFVKKKKKERKKFERKKRRKSWGYRMRSEYEENEIRVTVTPLANRAKSRAIVDIRRKGATDYCKAISIRRYIN
jgi:hypothetical protein